LDQLVLKENELVLVSDELGDIAEGRRRLGLYYRDTRYLSIFDLTINGQKPRLMASSSQQTYACDIQLAPARLGAEPSHRQEDAKPSL